MADIEDYVDHTTAYHSFSEEELEAVSNALVKW